MARATRSSTTQQDKQKPTDTDPPPAQLSKKRKRQSVLPHDNNDDHPASKQLRTDLRHSSEQQDDATQDPSSPPPTAVSKLPFAGDAPLDAESAQKILDILEITDSQGLLDRVFPLPSDAQQQQQSYSLRALLQQSSQHPLWILRAAVKQLLPISSHPRSQPSIPATSQRHFCDLALSLLDQASFHTAPIPLDIQTLFPVPTEPSDDAEPSSPSAVKLPPVPSSPTAPTKPRYALVQHLPNGDYWTSLNAETISSPSTELKDLPTGHADLVGILPTTSSTLVPPKDAPNLGSYNFSRQNPVLTRKALPEQRKISTGHFLDYGAWASFAPAFDHEAQVLGRRDLGEILWYKEAKRREAAESRSLRAEGSGNVEEVDVEMREDEDDDEVVEIKPTSSEETSKSSSIDSALGELLSPEEATAVKASLKTLELQNAVQELLQRNSRALKRLEDLQYRRLNQGGGGSSTVEEGSEEWDTAQGILDSLTALSSLRPRSLKEEETSAIMPSAKVLHKLHQTLALEPRPGWYGTLPPARPMALRDDTTVKVRPGALTSATTAAASATATASTPVTATPTPTSAASPYAGYSYYAPSQQATAAAQAYRPNATQYTPYKPGQYYTQPSYLTSQGTQQQSYYGQQGYSGAGATSQQPYAAYSSWYTSYAPMTATPGGGTPATGNGAATGTSNATAAVAGSTGSSGSGRGTPQPMMTTGTSGATPYGTFYGGTTATVANPTTGTGTAPAATPPPVPQRTPVVANTVMMATTNAGKSAGVGSGVSGYASQAQAQMAAAAAATWGMNIGMGGMGGMTYGQMVQGQQQLQQGQGQVQGQVQGQQTTGAQQQQQVLTLPMHLRPQQVQPTPAYYGAYQGQVTMQQQPSTTTPTPTTGR